MATHRDGPVRPRELLNRWAAQYGDVFKVRVGWYNWVFFNSPDAVKEVKRLHAFLKQLLNAKASAAFIPSQEFEIKQLLADLSHEAGKNSTDFYMHIRRMTFSIVMTSAYGLRIPKWDCQEVSDVYGNMRMLSIILSPGMFWIDVFPPLKWLPRFLFPLMAQGQTASSPATAPDCFAKDLIESNYRDYGLEEETVSWLASAVPEAGAETTASALNGLIRYLAMFPDAQARAHDEVTRVLGDTRMATLADEPNMPYIRAVIKETLPTGTILLANFNALHWDPERFPHPFHFKPERYLNHLHRSAVYAAGGDILARDNFTFGAGRRICPGIHLAENGLFLAVANIIWAYEFKLPLDDQGEEIPLDITDEGFMEGAIRVPKQYTVRILERNAARSRLIRSEWDQAQQAGYVLRGSHVDVNGGVRGGSKTAAS
ncbi:O-methylsterigmatocystin oxidoreductase [Aspergillus flavus AF70]|nr:O-methylsterigmatocystin oxidoreductase [Aspergillus flavus AF70]